MTGIKLLGVALLAVPAVALAQVGPNPATPGGSQSPTVGGSSDVMTAPQDARVGARASGQVMDRSTTTTTETSTSRPGSTMTPGEATGAETAAGAAGRSTTTETRTTTRTKGMERPRR